MKIFNSLKKLGLFTLVLVMAFGVTVPAMAYETEISSIRFYDYSEYDDEYYKFSSSDIESNMEFDLEYTKAYIKIYGTYDYYVVSGDDVSYSSSKDMYYVNYDDETDVTIKMYDGDGSKDRTYYITLTEADESGISDDSDDDYDYDEDIDGLDYVKFVGDDFYEKFTGFDSTMEFTVEYDEDELDITVDADSDYIVEWDGDEDSDNEWTIDLEAGETNKFTLLIYHEDDDEDDGEEIKFRIYREDYDEDDYEGALDGIEIEWDGDEYDMMPEFDPGVFNYIICLPEDADEVTFTPEFGSECETVKIDGSYYDDGEESDEIDVDDDEEGTTVSVIVKDEDDEYATYKFQLIRAQENDDDTDLDDLIVKMGSSSSSMSIVSLDPDFDTDDTEYTLPMNDDSAYYSFYADFSDKYSTAFVFSDTQVMQLEEKTYSSAIEFEDDDEVILRIYSSDHEQYVDYEFTFEERDLDEEYTLEGFEMDVEYTFSPTFSETTYYYTVTVPEDTYEVELTAVANSDLATIVIDYDETDIGECTGTVYISGTSTLVTIAVTSESGTTVYYKLNFVPEVEETTTTTTTTDTVTSTNWTSKIVLRIGSTTSLVNNVATTLTSAPYISNDRTMVPLRLISEQMGATVNYVSETKDIYLVFADKTLQMTVGTIIDSVGAAPEIVDSITFVPISYITGQLGAICQFDNDTKEVVIAY